MSKKLTQVLDYLLNEQEDKAKELLHSIFIEKARAIHEELMNMDDDTDESMGGDWGDDLQRDVHKRSRHLDHLDDEIDFEETIAEDGDNAAMDDDITPDDADDDIMDMETGDTDSNSEFDDDMGAADGRGDVMSDMEDTMGDLGQALEKLRAEFEKIEATKNGDTDSDMAGDTDDDAFDNDADIDDEDIGDAEVEESDDNWASDEDFSELDEALNLEVVAQHTYDSKSKAASEVGSGKYAKAETNVKSPIVGRKGSLMGAEPVDIDAGSEANGYGLQTAPTSNRILSKDNRRKQSTDGTSDVSTGNYGVKTVANSKLEKTASEFGADKGKKSPLSTSPRK